MAGASNRGLAAILGISEGAVRKARAGRLKGAVLPDGTLDVEKAKRLYAGNTDPLKQRDRPQLRTPPPAAAAPDPGPGSGPAIEVPPAPASANPDVNKARAFKIFEEAKITQIKRRKLEGTAIEKAPTKALVQTLARTYRDGLFGFADKSHAQMAAELGVDPFKLYSVLDAAMRRYVEGTIDRIKAEII